MVCNIYDTELNRVGSISTWVSMYWEEQYSNVGSFQLELQQTDGLLDLFMLDRYCGIPESETLMVIKSVEVSNGVIIVSGFPAVWVLNERVSASVIKNENAQTAMRRLVSSMAAWDYLSLGEEAEISDVFSGELAKDTVLNYCINIGQACDVGFRVRHDKANRKLLFECYQPRQNPNIKFSDDYGNVGEVVYSISTTNFKNVALVLGDGGYTTQVGNTSAVGVARREMIVDATSESIEENEGASAYIARIGRIGEAALAEQFVVENIHFAIDDDRVKLGDVVYCRFKDLGLHAFTRVVGLITVSEDNKITREAVLGTPIFVRRG